MSLSKGQEKDDNKLSISDFDRFVRYVNESEGYQFITVDKLNEILGESI